MPKSYQNSALPPFNDFESASRAILSHLHEKYGFMLWMMTRKEGRDLIVLHAHDQGYGIEEGTTFRWSDSICSRMLKENGPRYSPDINEIDSYRSAPMHEEIAVGAYVGIPVNRTSRGLFGTLCALDPKPQRKKNHVDLPHIELLSQCLSTILSNELEIIEKSRDLERTLMEASTDHLTGLVNRRGWEKSIHAEEVRAKRYGNAITVFIIDLDNLKDINDNEGHASGDELIKRAASCLRESVRESDLVARLGGDEFGILAVECNKKGAEAMLTTLEKNLKKEGIQASIGHAQRRSPQSINSVIAKADAKMYMEKESRRSLD